MSKKGVCAASLTISSKNDIFVCMTTLKVHIENTSQDAAVRTLLDALHVRYEDTDNGMDETEYLKSSPSNAARLNQAIDDLNQGKGVQVDLKTLFPK